MTATVSPLTAAPLDDLRAMMDAEGVTVRLDAGEGGPSVLRFAGPVPSPVLRRMLRARAADLHDALTTEYVAGKRAHAEGKPPGIALRTDYARTRIDPYADVQKGDRVAVRYFGRWRPGTVAEVCEPEWGGGIRVVLDGAEPWTDGSPEQPRCLTRFDADHVRLVVSDPLTEPEDDR